MTTIAANRLLPWLLLLALLGAVPPALSEVLPAEQARIVRLLVERVDLAPAGLRVSLRAEGLQALVAELRMRTAA